MQMASLRAGRDEKARKVAILSIYCTLFWSALRKQVRTSPAQNFCSNAVASAAHAMQLYSAVTRLISQNSLGILSFPVMAARYTAPSTMTWMRLRDN